MNEAIDLLWSDSPSFHPFHSQNRAVGPPDLHHAKGRGPIAAAAHIGQDVAALGVERDQGTLGEPHRRGRALQKPLQLLLRQGLHPRIDRAEHRVVAAGIGTAQIQPEAGALQLADHLPRLRRSRPAPGSSVGRVAERMAISLRTLQRCRRQFVAHDASGGAAHGAGDTRTMATSHPLVS